MRNDAVNILSLVHQFISKFATPLEKSDYFEKYKIFLNENNVLCLKKDVYLNEGIEEAYKEILERKNENIRTKLLNSAIFNFQSLFKN